MSHNDRCATDPTNASTDANIGDPGGLAPSGSVGPEVDLVVPVISQQELSEYLELQAIERSVRSLRQRKRSELIQKLQQEASVEQGPHQVRLELRPPPQINLAVLQDVYGDEWLDEVLQSLQPKPWQYLVISRNRRS